MNYLDGPRHPEAPKTVEALCGVCDRETEWRHDGEEPVTARSGAWGKYVAAIYVCQFCGARSEGHPETGEWSL